MVYVFVQLPLLFESYCFIAFASAPTDIIKLVNVC